MSPSIRVALLWHSVNSDNLGVTALTASNIEIVEQAARDIGCDVSFVVMGWQDPGAPQIVQENVFNFPMRARDLIDPRRLYAQIRRCHLVLDISAGDSFSDIYGIRRFHFNLLSKLAVKLAQRPLILSPQTIGPFHNRWARTIASILMGSATAVVTRDNLSTEYAQSLGARNVIESTDVAFRLSYDPPKQTGSERVKIGINVSGLLFNGGYTRDNMFALNADYQELVKSLIARFLLLQGCEIYLVSHVISDRNHIEDDYRTSQKLARKFPGVIIAPRFRCPKEAKSFIAGLDFFCGSRMHACIAAFSSGVPVVPIAYSRKFIGLFGSLGYDEVADCKTQSAEEIVAQVFRGYTARGQLKVRVEKARAAALTKLKTYSDIVRQNLETFLPSK